MIDHEEPSDDWEEDRPRDPVLDRAIARLRSFFSQAPTRLFYSTQIETALERDFFHWIVGRGLLELGNAAELTRRTMPLQGQSINFYASRKHRYFERQLKTMLALLARIYDPEFTHAIGRQGELMFDAALGRYGFRAEASNTKSWGGKTWMKTNHNLDRIVIRDGVAYGVEIKNTQNYISREELRTKIELCRHLGVKPLFIMRFAPKSYMFEIFKSGGFGLLFEEQMYPLGHTELLKQVRETFGLKVSSPKDVKDGDMQRLLKWHLVKLPVPPSQ
ncbi:MAG TPA: hypothetical protein VFB08_21040 [Burkholderiales bacterium]|nr:hypothetical protein [Burkholderiales bacterium]